MNEDDNEDGMIMDLGEGDRQYNDVFSPEIPLCVTREIALGL